MLGRPLDNTHWNNSSAAGGGAVGARSHDLSEAKCRGYSCEGPVRNERDPGSRSPRRNEVTSRNVFRRMTE